MDTIKYTDVADIVEYWRTAIAPNYFDFQNVNNYRTGIFGFITEVMGNTTEDSFSAINIAKREFYPSTAQNIQSFYKMAATHEIDAPMAVPGTAESILIVAESDVVSNGVFSNGVNTCVLDNSALFVAGDIPFMLDFPIVIVSKNIGDTWVHTTHYDISMKNALSDSSNRYIMNRSVWQNGTRYLFLAVTLRQVTLENLSNLIQKDSNLDTASIDLTFDGNIANFEVFYMESDDAPEQQLVKVMDGATTPSNPFCVYRFLDPNHIQLTFPSNPYFIPRFGSSIRTTIYTSKGASGTFPVFTGDLIAQIHSDRYPYNNNIILSGIINGSCVGGKDRDSEESFKNRIRSIYSTNTTITTSHDLQIYFDSTYNSGKNRTVFRKKRDDSLHRLYGSYSLMKDASDNVVPTNTVDLDLEFHDFLSQLGDTKVTELTRVVIRPGQLLEYQPNQGAEINYLTKLVTDLNINDDLNPYDDNSRFLFANPFLIAITLQQNIVGCYLNSLDTIYPVEYSYVNDNTLMQFISSNLHIRRNAMQGDNYYRLSITLSPSADLDPTEVIVQNDPGDEANRIRAKANGVIKSAQYKTDHIDVVVAYDDHTEEHIIGSNYVKRETDGTYTYVTGYDVRFLVGQKFVQHDILATKMVSDLGKIRGCIDIQGILYSSGQYISLGIEHYDADLNAYELVSYLSTDDTMSLDAYMTFVDGIIDSNGVPNDYVALPMSNISLEISTFYRNDDVNYPHKYSAFDYFKGHTMTNTYTQSTKSKISFITQVDFVRMTVRYTPGPAEDPTNYGIHLSEVPVVKANWLKSSKNFEYLIGLIQRNYTNLKTAYFLLENNFGIDYKFFNTYGKSRFFRVGIKSEYAVLDSVNCSFRFGVKLNSLSNKEIFLQKFKTYVKNYLESINDVGSTGQSIYILNLTTDLKNEYPEIDHLEYYGMNRYSHEAQKIESLTEAEIKARSATTYIPEFINVYSLSEDGVVTPKIDVLFLE